MFNLDTLSSLSKILFKTFVVGKIGLFIISGIVAAHLDMEMKVGVLTG